MNMKSEIRNSKLETNSKFELRICFEFRISSFGFLDLELCP
jgi:hypothetical protein